MDPIAQKHDMDVKTCPTEVAQKPAENSLVGLQNQGTTCYLNSIIQMLRMTPEFREAILGLPPEQLKSSHGHKGCSLLLELQKLFARLQLSARDSVSTQALTRSLGWSHNEHLVQQDVQEFLQILFAALGESLQSCSNPSLLTDLYHGQQVCKVTCSVCQRETDTEEDFVDVTLRLREAGSVEESLQQLCCGQETLQLSNQYHCSPCSRLVDATRTTKFRKLPPILMFTLARFTFDPHTGELCKDNKPISFPMELNMAPYMEKEEGDLWYDLCSVVLHRGWSAHEGHYHAFLRDVESRCPQQETEEETAPCMMQDREEETAPCMMQDREEETPLDILRRVLDCQPDKTLNMDRLCREFAKVAGAPWSKKYRNKWGPIKKFVQKNSAVFQYKQATHCVSLKDQGEGGRLPSHTATGKQGEASTRQAAVWFDFDDARVRRLSSQAVTLQAQTCVYMLAFRQRSLPTHRLEPPHFGVPEHLAAEVFAENARLEEERTASLNQVTVELHPACSFVCQGGLLSALTPDLRLSLTLDRRQSLAQLRALVAERCGGLIPEQFTLHHMKRVAGTVHLYEELKDPSCPLQTLEKHAMLFVWDGQSVDGVRPNCGADSEPIRLTILSAKDPGSRLLIPKTLTFAALKAWVSQQTGIPGRHLVLHRVVGDAKTSLLLARHDLPLSQIPLEDGDLLLALNSSSQRKRQAIRPRWKRELVLP